MYSLALNPDVQDKLRQQIRSGDQNKSYVKACLKECLRLYPVVSANLRHTSKDHVVAGYHIPEGVSVFHKKINIHKLFCLTIKIYDNSKAVYKQKKPD